MYKGVERFVTSSSRGLAEVIESWGCPSLVQFIHESVRDFCVGEMGLKRMWPNVSDIYSMGHERLKMYCQATLRYTSRTGSSYGEHYLEGKMDWSEWSIRGYAENYLLYHADQAAHTIPQSDLLHELETTYNLNLAIGKDGPEDISIMGYIARSGHAGLLSSFLRATQDARDSTNRLTRR